MGRYILRVCLGGIVLAAACSNEPRIEDATRFFNQTRIGTGPDAGLYRFSSMLNQWDHVGTVHGMFNDMDLCEVVVVSLKQKYPQDRYSCRLLN